MKLKILNFELNKNLEVTVEKYVFLVVDDETFIRSAVRRVIISELKLVNKYIDVMIIEANDGLECLLAINLLNKMNININAIISDETMPFISGSHCSYIIDELLSKGTLKEVNMFISTALNEENIIGKYSHVVKKVYSKPLNKNSIKDILKQI